MNLLGFVFGILLILSYASAVSFERKISSHKVEKSARGYLSATHQMLRSFETQTFKHLGGTTISAKPLQYKESSKKTPKKPTNHLNPPSARLNLWPIVSEGKENQPELYTTAARVLRALYPFLEKGAEQTFLDAWFDTIKKKELVYLEKAVFTDPKIQSLYYTLLKGKAWPALLDYIKIEKSSSQICLADASKEILSALFNPSAAEKIWDEIHNKKGRHSITQERLEAICTECHILQLDPSLLALLSFTPSNEKRSGKTTLIAKDAESQVELRKTVFLPKN